MKENPTTLELFDRLCSVQSELQLALSRRDRNSGATCWIRTAQALLVCGAAGFVLCRYVDWEIGKVVGWSIAIVVLVFLWEAVKWNRERGSDQAVINQLSKEEESLEAKMRERLAGLEK